MTAAHNSVLLIEQRLLPHEFKIVATKNFRETAAAISDMVVRGAGAIGATAAYGLAQGALAFRGNDLKKFSAPRRNRLSNAKSRAAHRR